MQSAPTLSRDGTELLVGLARTARASGVPADPARVQAMLTAAAELTVSRRDHVYWAGRLTLCSGPDDIARYDRAFRAYFAGDVAPRPSPRQRVEVERLVAVPGDAADGDEAEPGDVRAATASAAEVLRHRDIARLGTAEREQVRRMLAAIDPVGVARRSRRRHPSHHGQVDRARSVRATLRRGGEPDLRRHAPRPRPRRLVLLVDVSGSMAPYADALLRFAHAAARRRPGTEVFTLGTRLTRVTREIRHGDPDAAMAEVAGAVPDWSGGTRLGEQLKGFLDRWGQRGTARGAVVVVASDGWERGDATLLGEQMARLHRLAHRVVWVNPHKARPGYAPVTGGMAAALPSVDDFVEGHSLDALERLAAVVSGASAGSRRSGGAGGVGGSRA